MRHVELQTWAPTIHPFTPDGALDEEGLRAHLRRLAEAGVAVLVANEGTGESHTFSAEEMRRVLTVAHEELTGRTPVRGMGRMVRTPGEMIEFIHLVQDVGLEGVHIYTVELGHGMVPTAAEQEAYLYTVLKETRIPAFLSLNMVAGFQYPVDLVARVVADFPQVDGLIVNTDSASYLARLLDAVGDRTRVLVSPPHVLTGLALGANGLAVPEANIAPRTCVRMMRAYAAGDFPGAHELFGTIMRLGRLTEDYGKSALKAAVDALGFRGGPPRPPRLPLSDAARAGVKKAIDELGIREMEGLDD